jgi:hypothetical protein
VRGHLGKAAQHATSSNTLRRLIAALEPGNVMTVTGSIGLSDRHSLC